MDREQLIEAIIEALQIEEGDQIGLTTKQLAGRLGWSTDKVLRSLRVLREQGRLCSTKVPITKINDDAGWASAYYLTDNTAPDEPPAEERHTNNAAVTYHKARGGPHGKDT